MAKVSTTSSLVSLPGAAAVILSSSPEATVLGAVKLIAPLSLIVTALLVCSVPPLLKTFPTYVALESKLSTVPVAELPC